MKKILLSALLANMVVANGNMNHNVEVEKEEAKSFFQVTDSYIRFGYQKDGDDNLDLALGGKLHIDTKKWHGLSVGASFYTTQSMESHDGAGVLFYDIGNKSYTILGESYLKGEWKNTVLKIGRQEIDTPFADTDDIGMIPNTYRAALATNKDIADTTMLFGYIDKMSGVDSASPSKFTKINHSKGIQVVGAVYEGIENLEISGWYYNLKDFDMEHIAYIDANYEGSIGQFEYAIGLQYAKQTYLDASKSNIYGVSTNLKYVPIGLGVGVSYNKSSEKSADNGLGGGPFFTSSENLTLSEAGADGEALMLSVELDAKVIGLADFIFGLGGLLLTSSDGKKSKELDVTLRYAYSERLTVDIIYSDVEDDINNDNFKNSRLFVKYSF